MLEHVTKTKSLPRRKKVVGILLYKLNHYIRTHREVIDKFNAVSPDIDFKNKKLYYRFIDKSIRKHVDVKYNNRSFRRITRNKRKKKILNGYPEILHDCRVVKIKDLRTVGGY
jgi:hypothetical protein